MASAYYIPKQHLILATERAPSGFRPGNQARLQEARATNPLYAHTDPLAFMPGMGECRSGNGCSDLGLGGKWLKRSVTLSGLGSLASKIAAMRGAVEYQDASGNVITEAQYNALMAPPPPDPSAKYANSVYKDSAGNVITRDQYEALAQRAAQQKKASANIPAARALYQAGLRNATPDQAMAAVQRMYPGIDPSLIIPPPRILAKPPPKKITVVKKLPKRGVHGLGMVSGTAILFPVLAGAAILGVGIYALLKLKGARK